MVSSGDEKNPRIIALGSGNGGAGRTTVALELIRVMRRKAVSAVFCDCNQLAPVLIGEMNIEAGEKGGRDLSEPGQHLVDHLCAIPKSDLSILDLTGLAVGSDGADRVFELVKRLKRLDVDYIILDLPAGADAPWLDLFALADLPIVISGPESWSVRLTIPFLKAFKGCAEKTAAHAYLILNGCRDASERDLGEVLCHAIWRKIGLFPRYLGPVDFDDRRWFHLRHTDTLPPLSSSDGLGVQIEELVKRLLDVDEFDSARPRTRKTLEFTEVKDSISGLGGARWMGMSEESSRSELRAQYRRLWEGYRRDSAISDVLFNEEDRAAIISELEQTYRALQMALEDQPVGNLAAGSKPQQSAVQPATVSKQHDDFDEGSDPLENSEIDSEGHCGEVIRQRRQRGEMSLREISLRTRIRLRYLEAIETMEVEQLPPTIYLRGYLREIARILDLRVDSLLDRYLTELADIESDNTPEHSRAGGD